MLSTDDQSGSTPANTPASLPAEIRYISYENSLETQYLPSIRALISEGLSEPYSIYVYRYFLCQWNDLCFLAINPQTSHLLGTIICKLEPHHSRSPYNLPPTLRGYIAMLATTQTHRNRGIATTLVKLAIDRMKEKGADEVVLETEVSNVGARRLYENLGFIRSKKLWRYYLNGNTAFRLVLHLRDGVGRGEGGEVDVDGDGDDLLGSEGEEEQGGEREVRISGVV